MAGRRAMLLILAAVLIAVGAQEDPSEDIEQVDGSEETTTSLRRPRTTARPSTAEEEEGATQQVDDDESTTTTKRIRTTHHMGRRSTTHRGPTTTPEPTCIVTGYYYDDNDTQTVLAQSWEDCQQICNISIPCTRFSFWPTGVCELTSNEAPLVDSYTACEHFYTRNESIDKPCPAHMIRSGPRDCRDVGQWPSLRDLSPPSVYTSTTTTSTVTVSTTTTTTTTPNANAQRGFPWAAVVIPIIALMFLGGGAAAAWKLGYLPFGRSRKVGAAATSSEKGRSTSGGRRSQKAAQANVDLPGEEQNPPGRKQSAASATRKQQPPRQSKGGKAAANAGDAAPPADAGELV